ncbi:unnamed protein product [Rangifer tarandus platyrhynchus]|uniref:Uncharacterized protein n=2 Tax=Rangifer tarandus platyrhynchus TaxID=3082113 RepID=A0ACB0ENN2_RANTA|nr:unnamed protein product [Rangifer tarandus platyrhynchus]CAI9702362.1 unnamed protein product [Rangifer tarandus platyrhynchus]
MRAPPLEPLRYRSGGGGDDDQGRVVAANFCPRPAPPAGVTGGSLCAGARGPAPAAGSSESGPGPGPGRVRYPQRSGERLLRGRPFATKYPNSAGELGVLVGV